jgi:hypothetical protein
MLLGLLVAGILGTGYKGGFGCYELHVLQATTTLTSHFFAKEKVDHFLTIFYKPINTFYSF